MNQIGQEEQETKFSISLLWLVSSKSVSRRTGMKKMLRNSFLIALKTLLGS